MKYIGKYFLLAGAFVAVAGLSLRAQVNYLAPSNALVSAPASTLDAGQPDDSWR